VKEERGITRGSHVFACSLNSNSWPVSSSSYCHFPAVLSKDTRGSWSNLPGIGCAKGMVGRLWYRSTEQREHYPTKQRGVLSGGDSARVAASNYHVI
jgi:hypothetical protein